MPYNEQIEARVSKVVSSWQNTERKKMFGGTCHLLHGNMVCGVYKDFLILRLGEKEAQKVLALPSARPFDITGKVMKGWIMLAQEGFKTDDDLAAWLNKAREFVQSLPLK